jgi:hypothetical protein
MSGHGSARGAIAEKGALAEDDTAETGEAGRAMRADARRIPSSEDQSQRLLAMVLDGLRHPE